MTANQISRNAPCYCGSGKRYKHCHGLVLDAAGEFPPAEIAQPGRTLGDLEALNAQGVQAAQNGFLQEAVRLFESALAIDPASEEANLNLGTALFQVGRGEESVACLDKALAANPQSLQALNLRGCALASLDRQLKALADFDAAIALAGEDPAVMTNRGNTLNMLGRREESLACFERALVMDPVNRGALVGRSDVLNKLHRHTEALASADHALAVDPGLAEALNNRGNALLALRRHEDALASYDRVLAVRPDYAEALSNRGNALLALQRPDEALASYGRAVRLKPDYAEAHYNLGNALLDLGRPQEAVASCDEALSLKPDYAEAHNNLGNAFLGLARPDEAVASFYKAISLKPDYPEAYSNLGNALQVQSGFDEAVQNYRRALALKPDFAEAHKNLGNALKEQGKLDEAVASYQQALSCKPDFAEAHNNLGNALQDQGKLDEAVASYRQALSCKPDFAAVYSNLLFATQFCAVQSPEELLAIHAPFAAQFEAPLKAQWRRHQNTAEPARRLKVGYVSPDLRRHAVAFFIEPVLACHDSKQIEVFCYYNHLLRDGFTDRLAGYADHWLDCKSLPDPQLAERIRADGIDILVDLAGHTRDNRLLTFARKPAPIQITYLGYPGTSGLTAMDYRLTDGCADPAGSEAYYTEKLLRLPDSLCCYRPDRDMPQITALPARHNGYVTFGSFNNFNKIDRPCIELWARVLSAVPGSRLLMVTVPEGESRQRLTAQFGALGVAAQRLEFVGKLAQGEFLRTFQRADIALDPIAVTGGTTTCEALWMGLPVVVLVGARFTTRVGYSFLSAAGLQEFAAQSAQGYVQVAAKLAGDLTRLAQLRAGMRAQMARSPLVDEARFTRNLEKIYRQVWQHWCSAAT